jgi:malto-oligosyltrehalose trehalohydrolase
MLQRLSPSRSAFSFGPQLTEGGVLFRLWAPNQDSVGLQVDGDERVQVMRSLEGGWHEFEVEDAGVGTRYQFVLADGLRVPDPASRYQPDDVQGPSEVVYPGEYEWRAGDWRGLPWEQSIIYELHVGAFTPEGTFSAARDKLGHLKDLGVTAIEIMPIADFPGARNWGYDGALLFAPDSSYGRPEDLKALIDDSHRLGMMVFLDVVYNHFGPEGNYLAVYAPLFTERHHTAWGAAVNYDARGSETVRELIVENALYWIEEFRFDGLRLDAVHAIIDNSPEHILEELARRVRATVPDRFVHLILENEENDSEWLVRGSDGVPEHYTAQWNDDLHHVLHTAATGESAGYYGDYAEDAEKLGRALAEGFVFQGETMEYSGRKRGTQCSHLPQTAFVSFIQNHDQIGNRAFGERITRLASPEAVRALAAVYLLAPQVPMLFMGEEWGAAEAFPFFCAFEGDLGRSIREGRRAEFAKFPEFQDPHRRDQIPDPTAVETFASAKLNWRALDMEPHREWLAFYRRLISIRKAEILPFLDSRACGCGSFEMIGGSVVVRWKLAHGRHLTLTAHLSQTPGRHALPAADGRELLSLGEWDGSSVPVWGVKWVVDDAGGQTPSTRLETDPSLNNPDATAGTGMLPPIGLNDPNMQPSS